MWTGDGTGCLPSVRPLINGDLENDVIYFVTTSELPQISDCPLYY